MLIDVKCKAYFLSFCHIGQFIIVLLRPNLCYFHVRRECDPLRSEKGYQ